MRRSRAGSAVTLVTLSLSHKRKKMKHHELLAATAALEQISGEGHPDDTEMEIYGALRVLRPVAEDVRTHLRTILREYTRQEGDEMVWVDRLGYQDREAEFLAREAKGITTDQLPTFTRSSFGKLPSARLLLDLGPLFSS